LSAHEKTAVAVRGMKRHRPKQLAILDKGGIMQEPQKIHRKTNETDITLRLNLDGRG